MKFIIFLISLFYSFFSFSQEIEIVKPKAKKTTFTKKTGNFQYTWRDKYEYIGTFYDGIAKVVKDSKCGFIDKKGYEIIPLIYDDVGDFSEGLAQVKKGGKQGFVNKTGKEVIPLIYDDVFYFSEGLAPVIKDGKEGFIDKTGKEVIPCIYDKILSRFEYSVKELVVVQKDGRYFSINKKGECVADCP